VELGQILHSFGTQVVHTVRSKILKFVDEQVIEELKNNAPSYLIPAKENGYVFLEGPYFIPALLKLLILIGLV
jgi:hypothetical protein